MSRIVVTKPVEHWLLESSLSILALVVVVDVVDGPSCKVRRVVADYGLEDRGCDVQHVAMVFELEVPAIASVNRKSSEEMLFVRGAAKKGTA